MQHSKKYQHLKCYKARRPEGREGDHPRHITANNNNISNTNISIINNNNNNNNNLLIMANQPQPIITPQITANQSLGNRTTQPGKVAVAEEEEEAAVEAVAT